ncbi:hypothetical protein IPN41_03425 [Candidatus Falkowbacteria bacterium]|nr:MAG: hypothetical protein IPN41_03425 [Candidatus Falkowbacteria bacterium]
MLIIEEAIEKFNNDFPRELRLSCSAPEVIKPLRALESAYDINLAPLIINFAIGELELDGIADYIETEYQFEKVKARGLSREIEETILKPLLERVNFINASPNKEMTLEQEKSYVVKMFQSNLRAEILRPAIITDVINQRLLFILARELNFKSKLEQAIYDNIEPITSVPISINGQLVNPSINNWIKDFITQYGSQTYDSMSQSAFLINSNNAKNLTPGERELLAKVLKTYINIKFFPDSMPSDDGEGWEIIPVDEEVTEEVMPDEIINTREEVSEVAERQTSFSESFKPVATKPAGETAQKRQEQVIAKPPRVVSTPKTIISTPTPVKKPITPLAKPTPRPSPQQSQPPRQVVSRSPVETISNESDELLNLKNMLLQYPPHSLEREAIEEEIKKLEKV